MRKQVADHNLHLYSKLDTPFVTHVRELVEANSQAITEVAKKDLRLIENNLDLQYKIACYYVWAFGTPFHPSTSLTKILLSCFHKNLFSFFSSLELTRMGLYGPALILLRQVLEWVVVGKFCTVSPDEQVLQRWINGESISLSHQILSRIQTPDVAPVRSLWRELCRFTHATKFSQQVSFNAASTETAKGVFGTIAVLHALLECNYVLLNRHLVTPTLIYYAKRYSKNYRVREHKQALRNLFREARKVIAPELRQVVRCYRLTWIIR